MKLDDLTGGLVPSLPESNLGDLTGGLVPSLPESNLGDLTGGLVPSLPESDLGDLTGGLVFKLPELKLDDLTGGPFPSLPESNLGDLTGGLVFKLPELKLDDLTGGPFPSLPESDLGDLTGGLVPELPELKLDDLTGGPFPSLPESDLGGLTGGLVPELTELKLGGLTAGLFPELPNLENGLPKPLLNLVAYAEVARPLKSKDDSETDASLEYMLGKLDSAFAAQFRGAMLRSEERGPDWLTQAAASLRKLLLGVLHTAAPDDLVLPWVTRNTQLDQHGHPTRRTKIDWLCRPIRREGYRKRMRIKLDSAIKDLDLLNKAIHVNESPEIEESFTSVSGRVRFAIRRIATLWEQRRST